MPGEIKGDHDHKEKEAVTNPSYGAHGVQMVRGGAVLFRKVSETDGSLNH